MTDSQDRPKTESLPYDLGVEGIDRKDDSASEQPAQGPLQASDPDSGEHPRPHHPAGRRPLFRN